MERLNLIQTINPEWGSKIQCFLMDYPEFMSHIDKVPMMPNYPIPYTNVNTLFQALLHYICAVGVRYSYAINQWKYIFPLINKNSWEEICENMKKLCDDTRIQNKKRTIYYDVCIFMNLKNLTHDTIQPEDIKLIKENINGIGDGCIAWIKKYFTTDDDCIEYTDIYFKKGFMNIYGNETIKMRKAKTKEWTSKGYGRISNYMVLNCA